MDIKIYSMPSCPYCKMTKEYISSKGVSYQELDVSADKEAAEEAVKLSGQTGVPVLKINNEVIIGFDKERIDSLIVA